MKLAQSCCALKLCCRQHHSEPLFSRNEMILSILITKITHCGKLYAYYFAISFYRWEKKNTRTLSKTYSTFSLYSFLVMQKIITSHCVRKIKIPENKSFERTLNHRFFICIPEHMPINLALFYHTSWEIGWFTRRVKNRILLQSLKWNINYFMEGMEIKVNL